MVHFAVESTLHKRGFLGRVRDGEAASFQMGAESESDGVERLVEVFQGDAWSGGDSSPEDMLALYRVTCQARGCTALPVGPSDIVAVRSASARSASSGGRSPLADPWCSSCEGARAAPRQVIQADAALRRGSTRGPGRHSQCSRSTRSRKTPCPGFA